MKAKEGQIWFGKVSIAKAIKNNPEDNQQKELTRTSLLCGQATTTKGPTGQTTSHPTQMETTPGHSTLLMQVKTSTATC